MSSLDESYFVYVIAGGSTLDMINKLKSDKDAAIKELEKMAQNWGGTVSIGYYGGPSFQFDALPAGWTKKDMRGGSIYQPEEGTTAGEKISAEIWAQSGKLNIRSIFNRACETHRGTYCTPHEFSFEEIGGKTIVKCPPLDLDKGEYFIPHDSTVISFSAYAKMKEDAGLLGKPMIKTFKEKFQP